MSNKIIHLSQNQAQGIILLLRQYSTEKNMTSEVGKVYKDHTSAKIQYFQRVSKTHIKKYQVF